LGWVVVGCSESDIGEEGRVTTGGRGEIGKITGMAVDAPIMDSLVSKGMEHLVVGG
jgi:hypothetical protein